LLENGYASKSGKYDWTALTGSKLKKVHKDKRMSTVLRFGKPKI